MPKAMERQIPPTHRDLMPKAMIRHIPSTYTQVPSARGTETPTTHTYT